MRQSNKEERSRECQVLKQSQSLVSFYLLGGMGEGEGGEKCFTMIKSVKHLSSY